MRAIELYEHYVNAVGFDANAQFTKEQFRDEVWDILQTSYAPIGGIKGNVFETPQAMVDNIPFWKIAIRNGKVCAVVMYKDKHGRKSVALGTDGSAAGNWFITDIFKNELYRSYGEKSKAALGKLMKTIPWDVLESYIVTPARVAELNPHVDVIPVADMNLDDLPTDAKITLSRYPMLFDYGYLRDIGGDLVFKIMFGTIGKIIG